MNILLCVTGSVAAKITDKTIGALETIGNVNVKAAFTQAAQNFYTPSKKAIAVNEKTIKSLAP